MTARKRRDKAEEDADGRMANGGVTRQTETSWSFVFTLRLPGNQRRKENKPDGKLAFLLELLCLADSKNIQKESTFFDLCDLGQVKSVGWIPPLHPVPAERVQGQTDCLVECVGLVFPTHLSFI